MADFRSTSETTFIFNESIAINFQSETTGEVFQRLVDNQDLFSTIDDLVYETQLDVNTIQTALNEICERVQDLSLQIEFSQNNRAFRLAKYEESREVHEVSNENDLPSKHNAYRLDRNKSFNRIGYRHGDGKIFTMNNGKEIEFYYKSHAILFDQIQQFGKTNIPIKFLLEKYNDNNGKASDSHSILNLKNNIMYINQALKKHGIDNIRLACFQKEQMVVIETSNNNDKVEA